MLKLIARRLAIGLPVVLVVTIVSFALLHVNQPDPSYAILGPFATQEQIDQIHKQFDLDDPWPLRYMHWLGNGMQGDLGQTYSLGQQPVTHYVAQALPVTMALAIGAMLVALAIGVPIGVVSALRPGAPDRFLQAGAGLMLAVPHFWFAQMLVLVFALTLEWFAPTGWVPFEQSPTNYFMHLVLPVIALALPTAAILARMMRSSMLDVLERPFMRTLKAKGLSRRRLIWKHALRNAAEPVVTVLGLQFIGLLSGAIIVEVVFNLPGLSRLTIDAVNAGDVPLIQGVVVSTAVIVVVVNLLVDVIHAGLNPKVRNT